MSLSYGRQHFVFINTCLNPMKAPHAFTSPTNTVWSVKALEGAQLELPTLGGICVIYLILMWRYWLIPTICFGGWHIRMCSLTIIKPYDFVPSILENGASRGCKGQVMHPRKALFALSPNYHKLLADYKCFVLLWGNHLIFINIYLPHKPHMLSSLFMEYVGQWQPLRVHK